MNRNELRQRIAQKQARLRGMGQDSSIDAEKQAIKERMAEDVVVQTTRQGYIPTKRTLLSDAFTFTDLSGKTETTVTIYDWAKYTVPRGEKLIFAPFRSDFSSGYFWARVNSDDTGATKVNAVTLTVDILDPREQRNYATVVQASGRVLNTSEPADRDERNYFQTTKSILAEEGDVIQVKLEGVGTTVATISNSGSYFAFELYELIRAK